MVFMNRKDGTGVRARGDLSANAKPAHDSTRGLTDEQLITFADWMTRQVKLAKERGSTHVFVPIAYGNGVADAALEILHRRGQP
jgi:hypothetical protein